MARSKDGVVARIRRFNAGRDPERLALKYRAMRANPFAFLRGTCHLFHAELPESSLLRNAPLVWGCGDLHLENFGSYKGDNRLVYFDLNDFDDAALAPCTWDVLRFLTSVLVASETLGLTKAHAKALCQRFLQAHVAAIQGAKALWVERDVATGMVKELLDGLRGRQRKAFLDSRTNRVKGKRKIRIDGKRALPVTSADRARIEAFMRGFAKKQPNPGFFRLVDVARRIAGTASLGTKRYALLVEGKGSPNGNYFLDLKQALPSSLGPALKWKQPQWETHAHRVVALQRRLQAVSMAFLTPVVIARVPYVLRGLQPSNDRIAMAQWDGRPDRLAEVVATMGRLVAWAQLRSGGRQGSATTDRLIEFWSKGGRKKALLGLALECAKRVNRDWEEYCRAYDKAVASRSRRAPRQRSG